MITNHYLSLRYALFEKGKCRKAAVPATVPGTKAHYTTVDHPWEGESVGSQETCFKEHACSQEHKSNLRNGRLRTGVNMCRQYPDSAAGRIGIFFAAPAVGSI